MTRFRTAFPRPHGQAVRAGRCARSRPSGAGRFPVLPGLRLGERPAGRDRTGDRGRGVSARPRAASRFTIADAQAAAVGGRPVDQDAVSAAVSQVAAADDRSGTRCAPTSGGPASAPGSTRCAARPAPTAATGLGAYREVADLLLALYAKVRDESGLVHDPDADAFHLQESVAGEPADRGHRRRPPGRPRRGRERPSRSRNDSQYCLRHRPGPRHADVLRQPPGRGPAGGGRQHREPHAGRQPAEQPRPLPAHLAGRSSRRPAQAGLPASDPSIIVVQRAGCRRAASELSATILNEVDRLLDRPPGRD